MANVTSGWSGLSPTAKRNLAVGSICTLLAASIIGLALVSPEVAKPSSKQATIQHILTDSDPRSLGIDGISAQLRDLLNLTNSLMLTGDPPIKQSINTRSPYHRVAISDTFQVMIRFCLTRGIKHSSPANSSF